MDFTGQVSKRGEYKFLDLVDKNLVTYRIILNNGHRIIQMLISSLDIYVTHQNIFTLINKKNLFITVDLIFAPCAKNSR